MRVLTTVLGAAVVAAGLATPATAQEPQIQEWQVPWENSRPRDPYVAPDGKVWFVGQRTHYLAVFDPQTAAFEKTDLEDGTGPHNLIVDTDGTIWYAGNRAAHIGTLNPATGEIEKIMMPDERARDPHTLVFDGQGNIWFTLQGANMIGKLVMASGEVSLVEAPTIDGGQRGSSSRPYGIKVDSHGRPWAVLVGTNLIATVDPTTMELSTYELPADGARPRRLEITSNDQIYYVDFARGYLGHFDPTTRQVEEWQNPGGAESRPYGMAIDRDDRVWFVETGPNPNTFVGFDTATKEFLSVTPIASGAGSVRHMYYDEDTNSIWFGTDANTIGRAKLPPKQQAVGSRQ